MNKSLRSCGIWMAVLATVLLGGRASAQQPSAVLPPGQPPGLSATREELKKPEAPKARIAEQDGLIELGGVTIDAKAREVSVPCRVNQREGLLEYTLVGETGKRHESLLWTAVEPYNLQVALLLLGLQKGRSLDFQGDPRRPEGDPVRLRVEWSEAGVAKTRSLESLVRNQGTNAPMQETDWIFTGSKMWNGIFAAQAERSIIAVFHDPAAIIDNPLPDGGSDKVWVPNPETTPPVGTPVTLVIKAVK